MIDSPNQDLRITGNRQTTDDYKFSTINEMVSPDLSEDGSIQNQQSESSGDDGSDTGAVVEKLRGKGRAPMTARASGPR